MKLLTGNPTARQPVDIAERRVLFDTSWPLLLFLLAAAYVLSWSLGVLAIDLSAVLWTTFGLALAYQVLSRLLDFAPGLQRVIALHVMINVAAVTGLAFVWSQLGGLASPAFAFFFAIPIIALGLIARLAAQYTVTLYTILAAWFVAVRESADLRLQLEAIGVPPFWYRLSELGMSDSGTYGAVVTGSAQLQFMLVFSFAMIGVATTSAIVVVLIGRLFERLRFASASGERAEKITESFVDDANDLELILDRNEQTIIAISPRLAELLDEIPESVVGCHFTSILPFHAAHPARRLIESGESAALYNQGMSVGSDCRLVNVRTHAGTSGGYEFQRITFAEPTAKDYAQLAVDVLGDRYGAIDGQSGRVLYLSDVLATQTGVQVGERADWLSMPAGWWQIGARREHTRRVPLDGCEYDLRLRREEFYGDHSLAEVIVFRLHPVGGGS
ncbi:MAG: hypothetical protein R3288_05215 [Woeseiaceae bacterium]|nr:hypothetical protein [Woeseiaceae bacterium]